MKRTNYCSKCKAKDKVLLKYSYSKKLNTQYHLCRGCQSNRLKIWNNSENGKKRLKKRNQDYHRKNARKNNARNLLNYHISMGNISKPIMCSSCTKKPETGRIEGHHHDYKKPLDVVWLCSPCHNRVHSTTVIQ